jgi:2,3-bisphosphoglycerate-independent phosphoglycerate mutase
MRFPDGGINTQHSTNPVPVAFVSPGPATWSIRDGELADVAPTLLELLGIPIPDRMTGRPLLSRR